MGSAPLALVNVAAGLPLLPVPPHIEYFEGEASESVSASAEVTVEDVAEPAAVLLLRERCILSRHHCRYDSRAICSSMASLVASQSVVFSLSSNMVCSISSCSLRRTASLVWISGL